MHAACRTRVELNYACAKLKTAPIAYTKIVYYNIIILFTAFLPLSVVDYVSCDVIALSRSTGLPHELLAGIRQALLAQYASLPTSASEIWRDTEKTAAILPTGRATVKEGVGGTLETEGSVYGGATL